MKKIIVLLLAFSSVKAFSQQKIITPIGTFTVKTIRESSGWNRNGYETKKIYSDDGSELVLPMFCSDACPIDFVEFYWDKCENPVVTINLTMGSYVTSYEFVKTCRGYEFLNSRKPGLVKNE